MSDQLSEESKEGQPTQRQPISTTDRVELKSAKQPKKAQKNEQFDTSTKRMRFIKAFLKWFDIPSANTATTETHERHPQTTEV